MAAWPAMAVAADDAEFKRSQFFRGITSDYTVTATEWVDVDGDGSSEYIVCYREPDDAVNQQGGVLVLRSGIAGVSVAWHAFFENAYPSKVRAQGGALTFELLHKTQSEEKKIEKTFVHGKDFFFRSDEGSPFAGVKIKASSTLKAEGIKPGNVFDRDLQTPWAEGAEGTGVDETLTFEFRKPVNIGLIGVLHGDFRGKRNWVDNNRLHRAEATVETSSDRYDADSDVDFDQDLGLGLYGDKIEMTFSNRPILRYFRLGKRAVVSLELRITSVLLGEKNDDTYISEVDFAEMIPAAVILGKEPPAKAAEKIPPADAADDREDEPKQKDDWTDDSDF